MNMSTGGKVLAISIGVLGGGGLGFLYKETMWADKKEKQCKELRENLERLKQERTHKEKLLAKFGN